MPATLYTLFQLQQFALDTVEGNSLFYTYPELTYAINEAIRTINLVTGFLRGTATIPGNSVAGQLLYNTPPSILFPMRVQFEKRMLDPVSLDRIGNDYATWATDTTNKLGNVQRWIPFGTQMFAIHPIDSIGGGVIYVTGVLEPTLLVNGSDSVSLEDEFVDLIVTFCRARLPLKEGGAVFASASRSQQDFYRKLKTKKMIEGLKFPQYFTKMASPVVESKGSN
jgi:hypothetical protein